MMLVPTASLILCTAYDTGNWENPWVLMAASRAAVHRNERFPLALVFRGSCGCGMMSPGEDVTGSVVMRRCVPGLTRIPD